MTRRVIRRSPTPSGKTLTGKPDSIGRPTTRSLFKRNIRGITKPRPAVPRPAIPEIAYEMTVEQVREACDTGLMVEVRETAPGVTKGEQGMIVCRLGPDLWQVLLLDRGVYWTFETKEIYPVFVET